MPPSVETRREPLNFPAAQLGGRKRRVALTVSIVATLWIPCAALSRWQSPESLRWFISDFAAQTRILIIVPLLILGWPALAKQLHVIADHFSDAGLVSEAGEIEMERSGKALRNEADSVRVQFFLLFLSYVAVFSLLSVAQTTPTLLAWCLRPDGSGALSPAGLWYRFAATPFVVFLLFRWIWRQILWARFLHKTTRLDLRLNPAHPDCAAGLGFVETCHRKYLPLCLAMGTLLAGSMANHVVYLHQPVTTFKVYAAIQVFFVVAICIGPLCVFFHILLSAKRQGVFEYGVLALSMGERFKQKWIAEASRLSEDPLHAQDFSATTDLYSVVANVHEMKHVPFKSTTIARLAVWTLIPMIPVALTAVPVDVLAQRTLKLLL
jgi:hypothetical protein